VSQASVNDALRVLHSRHETPTRLREPETHEQKPIEKNMPTTTAPTREYEESPVRGCLVITAVVVVLCLGVWKAVELIILFGKHFAH
jgi:hypothetical protein